jgi:hypothetical protein
VKFMNIVLEEELEPLGKVRSRKTRYRVSLPLPKSEVPVADVDATVPVLVDGGVLSRPLTEPAPGAKPASSRVLFVYADSVEEAERKVRGGIQLPDEVTLVTEEAGYVEDGIVHFPPDEEAAVKASMQDGRKAPGA